MTVDCEFIGVASVCVDVHVHVDGVGETSLLLIDVVNGGSLILRV